MIEIIKPGKLKHICNKCDCLFSYAMSDTVKEDIRDDHGIAWRTDYTLNCPFCGAKQSVKVEI